MPADEDRSETEAYRWRQGDNRADDISRASCRHICVRQQAAGMCHLQTLRPELVTPLNPTLSVCLSSCLSHLAAAIAAAAGARRLAAPHSWVPVAAAAAPHTQSVSCTTAVGRGGLLVRKQKDVALPGLREGCETQAPRSACRSQCDMEL